MLIKYKGQTSAVLTDLCIELKISVDLKTSEEALKTFFRLVMQELDSEKAIGLISKLPTFLKPFCHIPKKPFRNNENEIKVDFTSTEKFNPLCARLFTREKMKATIKAILKVMDKYLPLETLIYIYSCFPETLFYEIIEASKKKLAV